jgi:histidinol-phosphate aminotransferase
VILAERPRLRNALEARGAPSPPSQANFLLVRVGDRASVIGQGLLKAGILVRDGAGVGFPGHLRIAIGTPAQNNRLLTAWDQAIKQ